MEKLNVGSALILLPNYTNIDFKDADINCDIRKGLPFKDNEVEEILASHILEHLSFKELPKVLDEFYRVLAPGKLLHIRVPDILKSMKAFIENKDGKRWKYWIKEIYGGQWGEGEFHKNCFTKDRLIEMICYIGFEVQEILPPRKISKTEINIKFKKIK